MRLVAVLAIAIVLGACSPEAVRMRGGGPGADRDNTGSSIELHGDQSRNNPSFGVPMRGSTPVDSRGVDAWWRHG